MRFAWKTLVLCGALTVCLPSAGAGTLYVDDNAPAGGNGGSWETAYTFLQDALTAAVSGDEIRVAQGTYYPDRDAAHPTGTGDRAVSFTLKDGVALIGGYAGLGAPEPNERSIALCVAILSGDIGTPGSNSDNSYHVVRCGSVGPTALLDGFTITGGNADGSFLDGLDGGGVHCNHASPTLTNCTITGNRASSGGGVYAEGSSAYPTLTNCMISDNTATGVPQHWYDYIGGGGVYLAAEATLFNCTIMGNSALYGGGVYFCGYSHLTNCMIFNNTANHDGGGVYSFSSGLMTNCIIWANRPEAIKFLRGGPGVTYCDVQGGWEGTGNIDVDPGFAFPGDYHLLSTSPCVDAGTNNPVSGLPATDSDGQPRSLDGDGDGQAVADIGVDEFDPATPTLALGATTLAISARMGHTGSQTLEFRNCSLSTMAWEVQSEADWLTVDPPAGQSVGEAVTTVTVTADATNLAYGTYVTRLWVDADQACNTPQPVTVVVYATRASHVPSEYPTIRAAIDAAILPGDEVVIADGVYTGTDNKNLNPHVHPITVRSASGNPAACVIDCEGSGRGFIFDMYDTAPSIVRDLTIRNGDPAGAVDCHHATVTLINCTIMRDGTGSGGRGVCCTGSNMTLTNCRITGFAVSGDGAGIHCNSSSSLTLNNCTITGNTASGNGGGILCNSSSSLTLINCTITGNTASGNGGGIHCDSSSPTLINCTIASNKTPFNGGGLFCASTDSNLTNCILWANTPQAIFYFSGSSVVTYCDVQGGWTGTGNIDANPRFVRNPSPGGDGQWGTADDDFGDLHLMSNSPCIDAGDNAAVPGGTTTDLEGDPRLADTCRPDTGNGTPPIVDMGAYEAPGVPSTDCNANGVPDACDILNGTSADANGNGVPDECDPCFGDMNCDGIVVFSDINAFVLYLSNLPLWGATYPGCNPENGDINGDGVYPSFVDINPFVNMMAAVPVPCGNR